MLNKTVFFRCHILKRNWTSKKKYFEENTIILNIYYMIFIYEIHIIFSRSCAFTFIHHEFKFLSFQHPMNIM